MATEYIMIIEITAMMFRVDDSILFFEAHDNHKSDSAHEADYEIANYYLI